LGQRIALRAKASGRKASRFAGFRAVAAASVCAVAAPDRKPGARRARFAVVFALMVWIRVM